MSLINYLVYSSSSKVSVLQYAEQNMAISRELSVNVQNELSDSKKTVAQLEMLLCRHARLVIARSTVSNNAPLTPELEESFADDFTLAVSYILL